MKRKEGELLPLEKTILKVVDRELVTENEWLSHYPDAVVRSWRVAHSEELIHLQRSGAVYKALKRLVVLGYLEAVGTFPYVAYRLTPRGLGSL